MRNTSSTSSTSEWVVIGEFAKRTGKTANAVRQNINSGGSLYKFAKKFDNRLWINLGAFRNMMDDLTF